MDCRRGKIIMDKEEAWIHSYRAFLISIIAIMLLFPMGVIAQQNPSISFISKEQVVEIGDRVEVKCTTQYANDYPVVWIKVNPDNSNNNLFISRGSTINIPHSRYSVRIEMPPNNHYPSSTNILTIDRIQEVDTGRYLCEVITGAGSFIKAETDVFVRIPPIISDNSTRSVITAVGADVDLYCYASGFPKPSVSWRREKQRLIPAIGALYRGNHLVLRNVTKDDRGTYYCVADNGVSSGARRSVGVEIEFVPYVTAERPRYGQALQYTAILQCHVESFPSPSIEWYKDGLPLTDNQHYEISIFATSEEFSDTSLKVNRIEKKQYGNYTCKATNKLGSDYKMIELFETVNVVCPPACDPYLNFASAGHGLVPSASVIFTFVVVLLTIFR